MATWQPTPDGFGGTLMVADFGPLATGDTRLPEIPTVPLPSDMAGLEWGFRVPPWGIGPTSFLQRSGSTVNSGVTWELDTSQSPPLLDSVPRAAHFIVMVYNSTKTQFTPSLTPEQAAPPAYATGGTAPNPTPTYRFDPWMQDVDYTFRGTTNKLGWNAVQSAFLDVGLWPQQVHDAYAGVGHVNTPIDPTQTTLSSQYGSVADINGKERAEAHYGLWQCDLSNGGAQFYSGALPVEAVAVQYEWETEETVSFEIDVDITLDAGVTDANCTLYRAPAQLDPHSATWRSHGDTLLMTAGTAGDRKVLNLPPTYGTDPASRKVTLELATSTLKDRRIFGIDEVGSAGMTVFSSRVHLRPARHRFVYPLRLNPLRQRQRQDGLAISAPRQFSRNRPKSKQISVRAGWESTYL